jgi:ribonuclease D
LTTFLQDQDITFVGVYIRSDSRLLKKEWIHIPQHKYIDIQDIYKIEGRDRAGMAAIAAKLIDPKFQTKKANFKNDYWKREGHDYWEWKPLSEKNLHYASLDGYMTYEIFRRISLVNEGQAHLKAALCPSCIAVETAAASKKRQRVPAGWN